MAAFSGVTKGGGVRGIETPKNPKNKYKIFM